jgi:mannose-6-phosphate isomerase-like protein (cupin superfamily)
MSTRSDKANAARAFVVSPDGGPSVRWGPAGTMRIVAGAGSTDGTFSLCEVTEPPDSAAPLHVHHGEAEAFYILEGTIELTCGEQSVTATAGDFAYAPRDVPHKYVVIGPRPARVLLMFSPPGFESFFAEAGAPLDQPAEGPPDPTHLQRLAEKYECEILEPPAH